VYIIESDIRVRKQCHKSIDYLSHQSLLVGLDWEALIEGNGACDDFVGADTVYRESTGDAYGHLSAGLQRETNCRCCKVRIRELETFWGDGLW